MNDPCCGSRSTMDKVTDQSRGDSPCLCRECHLKHAIAMAALGLWVVSLGLPVLDSYDAPYPGWKILLLTMYGIAVPAVFPLLVLNSGLLYLFWWNTAGKSSAAIGSVWYVATFVVLILLITDAYGYTDCWLGEVSWRIGVVPWFESMFFIGIATRLQCPLDTPPAGDPE